jgi:hypothetical protein
MTTSLYDFTGEHLNRGGRYECYAYDINTTTN